MKTFKMFFLNFLYRFLLFFFAFFHFLILTSRISVSRLHRKRRTEIKRMLLSSAKWLREIWKIFDNVSENFLPPSSVWVSWVALLHVCTASQRKIFTVFRMSDFDIVLLLCCVVTDIIIIIIIIIFVINFMHGIYNYTPETNHISRVYSVAVILYLQFVLYVMLVPMLTL